MDEFDTEIKKMKTSNIKQSQLPKGTPFYFEDLAKNETAVPEPQIQANGFMEWVKIHKIAVGIGSLLVAIVIGVTLIY